MIKRLPSLAEAIRRLDLPPEGVEVVRLALGTRGLHRECQVFERLIRTAATQVGIAERLITVEQLASRLAIAPRTLYANGTRENKKQDGLPTHLTKLRERGLKVIGMGKQVRFLASSADAVLLEAAERGEALW